jgi:hypothetical protein
MYSPINSSEDLNKIEHIKNLAEEMVERRVEFEINFFEEENFHKIMLSNSMKHKSLMFDMRKKKKILKHFSLNKVKSIDSKNQNKNILNQRSINGSKRKSTMDEKDLIKNRFKKRRKGFALHASLKNVLNHRDILDSDEIYEGKNSESYLESLNFNYNNQNENEKENNNKINNEYNDNNESNFLKYEIKYVHPKEVALLYDKEITSNNKYKSKSKSFFDKEMKFLKIKEKKIEKKRKRQENRNKNLFQV